MNCVLTVLRFIINISWIHEQKFSETLDELNKITIDELIVLFNPYSFLKGLIDSFGQGIFIRI